MWAHTLIQKHLILPVAKERKKKKERLGGKAEKGSKEKVSWTELSKGKTGIRAIEKCRLEETSGDHVVLLHSPSRAHFNVR